MEILVMLEKLLSLFIYAHIVEHPVFKPTVGSNSIDSLKARVEPVLELTEGELIDLIPTRSGFIFVGCPNCDEGTQEGELSWNINAPNHVFCRYCQMRFPNEKFPDTRILKATNPLGKVQEYPYWEDENGYRYFFQAKGWYVARGYFSRIASELATLYRLTDETPYARRAALILDRFAQFIPATVLPTIIQVDRRVCLNRMNHRIRIGVGSGAAGFTAIFRRIWR